MLCALSSVHGTKQLGASLLRVQFLGFRIAMLCVLSTVLSKSLRQVLQIKQLTPAGVVQLCVDLDYLRKVPPLLGEPRLAFATSRLVSHILYAHFKP